MKSTFDKTYGKLKFRLFIRNFSIVFPLFILLYFVFWKLKFTGNSIGGFISQAFIMSLAFSFWTHNIFHKSDMRKRFELLRGEFPYADENTIYLLLFAKLERAKFEEKPELAIRKMNQVNFWLRIKHAELKPDEVKKLLAFIFP